MLSEQPMTSVLGSIPRSPLYLPQGAMNPLPIQFQDSGFANLGPFPSHIDPNSPEIFKSNIHLAQEHLLRIQQLAQNAIEAIGRAYQPSTNPMQASGEVIALKHSLEAFADFLRDTGLGSLSLIAPDDSAMPTEQQMIEDMTKSTQALFERRQRMQENAAGIASLLAPPETRQNAAGRK